MRTSKANVPLPPPPAADAPTCADAHRRQQPAATTSGPAILSQLLPPCAHTAALSYTCTQVLNVSEADPTVRMHAAITSGDTASVAACLAAGAAADRPVQGCSALFRACKLGHAPSARLLLSAGADPNWRSSDGTTPLHAAASGRSPGHHDCAVLLLAAGADACATDRGLWLPLHTAAHHGNAATVQLLLAAAPHTVLAQHGGGLTSLHQSAFSGRAAAARVLVAAAPEAALMRWVQLLLLGLGCECQKVPSSLPAAL